MKYYFLLTTIFLIQFYQAQSILVPYFVNGKVGLCDQNRKVLLKPKYADLKYLAPDYFIFTIPADEGNENKSTSRPNYSYGLLKGSKMVINSQEHPNFFVHNNLVISSRNAYRPEYCRLYNLRGKLLIDHEIKAVYINDRRDIGNLSSLAPHLTIVSFFGNAHDNRKLFNLVVYDQTTQEIVKWLLRDVEEFESAQIKDSPAVQISYKGMSGRVNRYLHYTGTNFEVIDVNPYPGKPLVSKTSYSEEHYTEGGFGDVVIPQDDGVTGQQRKAVDLYFIKNGKVHFGTSENSFEIDTENIEIISLSKTLTSQFPDPIYRKGRQYGHFIDGKRSQVLYDSLLYTGTNYIAAKESNHILKFGIIDKHDKWVVPAEYDSIRSSVLQYSFESQSQDGRNRAFNLKEKTSYRDRYKSVFDAGPSATMQVFKQGKTGIISISNEIIIPIRYDLIADNGINYIMPLQSNFMLLKSGERYGFVTLNYDTETKKWVRDNSVEPIFSFIPTFYIDNYYGKKGFRLYGLSTATGEFAGYGSSTGKTYIKNQ